jgi:hypothetical protein
MSSNQLCIYCGVEKAATVDHIPPRLLLDKPYPADLLTVPACFRCNQSFQKDDEYTRTVVLMDLRVADVPTAKRKIPSLLRSFERPEGQGFTQYLASQIEPGRLYGPDGRTIDKLRRDENRTNATGLHILKGLYFAETGNRLDTLSISVQIDSKMGPGLDSPVLSPFLGYYEQAQDKRQKSFGNAFSYRAIVREHLSAWLLLLYDRFSWFAVVRERTQNN